MVAIKSYATYYMHLPLLQDFNLDSWNFWPYFKAWL